MYRRRYNYNDNSDKPRRRINHDGKEEGSQNKIKLVTSDPIRVRIRFRKNKTEDVAEICRELGVLT